MNIKNPCIHSNDTAWCNNKNIKKSLFGIGARCCKIYPQMNKENCNYFEMILKPNITPPTGGSRNNADINKNYGRKK